MPSTRYPASFCLDPVHRCPTAAALTMPRKHLFRIDNSIDRLQHDSLGVHVGRPQVDCSLLLELDL
eukprot:5733506-Heterocapsa_arctica.AAC.1